MGVFQVIAEYFRSHETDIVVSFKEANFAEVSANLSGELISCLQGPFYLMYDHNHSKASTVMLTFQREEALQLLSAPMEMKRMLR